MSHGKRLKEEINKGEILPLIGVFDVFSATIAAQYYNGVFLSGFGFAASYYGLPGFIFKRCEITQFFVDIGFIAWPDIVGWVTRVRTVLPDVHIVVDIDDGYCDTEVACHVVSLLEKAGASAVVMEDQKRPRRCGHFEGKQILELDQFTDKLKRVLSTR
jgi:2-methylisocitrate lyase-like PEP mutase family enzyme